MVNKVISIRGDLGAATAIFSYLSGRCNIGIRAIIYALSKAYGKNFRAGSLGRPKLQFPRGGANGVTWQTIRHHCQTLQRAKFSATAAAASATPLR